LTTIDLTKKSQSTQEEKCIQNHYDNYKVEVDIVLNILISDIYFDCWFDTSIHQKIWGH